MPFRLFHLVLALCVAATVWPLWVGTHLPAVDAPEHLFLVHVLRSLRDEASFYASTYESGLRLTYLTFYWSMAWLADLFGEETALRIWLTLVHGAMPLGVVALLRAFKKPEWLGLLACPLVFTDSFYWGLVAFQSALVPTLFGVAWFVRTLDEPLERRRWAVMTALAAVLVMLTHAAMVPFAGLSLLVVFLTTRTDRAHRVRALVALVPGALLFLAWLVSGVHKNRKVANTGEHWSAAGSLFDAGNYTFTPVSTRAGKLVELLSNGFWDWADRPSAVIVVTILLVVSYFGVARWWVRRRAGEREVVDLRPVWLLLAGLGSYLLLPTDVKGYMYMIHPRYAQIAGLLAVVAMARPRGPWLGWVAAVSVALALGTGFNHARLFARFDAEATTFETVAAKIPKNSRILHLVVDKGSRVATHQVYLHYPALAALRAEGIPSFSLALDPSFPVNYREGGRPPAPDWEWRPERFTWEAHGRHYDAFLVRGSNPRALFKQHLSDVELVTSAGKWKLFRRIVDEGAEP